MTNLAHGDLSGCRVRRVCERLAELQHEAIGFAANGRIEYRLACVHRSDCAAGHWLPTSSNPAAVTSDTTTCSSTRCSVPTSRVPDPGCGGMIDDRQNTTRLQCRVHVRKQRRAIDFQVDHVVVVLRGEHEVDRIGRESPFLIRCRGHVWQSPVGDSFRRFARCDDFSRVADGVRQQLGEIAAAGNEFEDDLARFNIVELKRFGGFAIGVVRDVVCGTCRIGDCRCDGGRRYRDRGCGRFNRCLGRRRGCRRSGRLAPTTCNEYETHGQRVFPSSKRVVGCHVFPQFDVTIVTMPQRYIDLTYGSCAKKKGPIGTLLLSMDRTRQSQVNAPPV